MVMPSLCLKKMTKLNKPNQQRPSGAAPLGSRDFYEKPNPYWIQQARKRGRVGPQGLKLDKKIK